jgi:uncharacterized protein
MENQKTSSNGPVISNLAQYKVSKNLLRIEKNGQLLLTNTLSITPLLITQGKELVEAALNAVGTSVKEPPGDEQLYQTFLNHHIIVPSSDDEKAPYVDFSYNPEEKKSGMTMYMLVSQDCNLRCKYCFAHEFPYRQKKQMPFDVATQAIRRNVKRLLANGKISIVEKEIKPEHKKKEFPYHITTNLTNLPDDFVQWIKRYKITLLTDLDGHRAFEHNFLRPTADGKGSFEQIINNIAMLNKEGIKVEVRSTICASNQDYIFEISKKMNELNGGGAVLELVSPFDCLQRPIPEDLLPDIDRYIKNVSIIYRSGSPPVENIFPINKKLERLRDGKGGALGCGMPWGNIHVIDHLGDVYMCTYLVGQEKYKMGNVFDDGFTYSNEEKAVRNALKSVHVDHVQSCSKCSWRYLCSGHCPIARLAVEANEEKGQKVPAYVKKYTFAKSCKMSRTFYETLLWDLASNKLPVPPVGGNRADTEPICCT